MTEQRDREREREREKERKRTKVDQNLMVRNSLKTLAHNSFTRSVQERMEHLTTINVICISVARSSSKEDQIYKCRSISILIQRESGYK